MACNPSSKRPRRLKLRLSPTEETPKKIRIPSPAEVEAVGTRYGQRAVAGWSYKQLMAWGVSCPPERGWRLQLKLDYERQESLKSPRPANFHYFWDLPLAE